MPETRLERTRRAYSLEDTRPEAHQPAPLDLEGATVMIDGVLHALKHVEDRRERRIAIKFKREHDIEPNKYDHRS